MKRNLKATLLFSLLSALVASPIALFAGAASAQPVTNGMTGSYVGGGVSVGIGQPGDNDAIVGGNVQGRYAVPQTPISVRAAALIGGNSTALMPLVTYDAPVARNTNLYLGGGYSFVTDQGHASPLGDRNAPVIVAGLETAVRPNVALYGDVKLGINGYQNSNNQPVSFQLGGAYRF